MNDFFEENIMPFIKCIMYVSIIIFTINMTFWFGLEIEKNNIQDICYCPSCGYDLRKWGVIMYDIVIDFICDLIPLIPVLFGIRIIFDYFRILIFESKWFYVCSIAFISVCFI